VGELRSVFEVEPEPLDQALPGQDDAALLPEGTAQPRAHLYPAFGVHSAVGSLASGTETSIQIPLASSTCSREVVK
jgi:hypothetical protein